MDKLKAAARAALIAFRRMKSIIKQEGEESGVITIYNNARYWPLSQLRDALAPKTFATLNDRLLANVQQLKAEEELYHAVQNALKRFRELYDWMERDESGEDDDWDEPPYQANEIGESIRIGFCDEDAERLKAALTNA